MYSIEEKDCTVVFTIKRMDKHNAINDAVMEGLKKAIHYVRESKDVCAFVITGEGEKAFCSGGDLAEFQLLQTEGAVLAMMRKMTAILYDIATLPVPTIALINGVALGGGCELATACDYRLLKKETRCGFIQGTLAITTAWGGGTLLFERNLRHDYTMRLLAGAERHDSETLQQFGWATSLYEGDKNEALIHYLNKHQPTEQSVFSAYKKMVVQKMNVNHLRERMDDEVVECAKLWMEKPHLDAVAHFFAKSKK